MQNEICRRNYEKKQHLYSLEKSILSSGNKAGSAHQAKKEALIKAGRKGSSSRALA
jgi:hypothetical protein